ncbi:MAG: hypothetical protein MHPSP_000825 [Paramarteilia canceri]
MDNWQQCNESVEIFKLVHLLKQKNAEISRLNSMLEEEKKRNLAMADMKLKNYILAKQCQKSEKSTNTTVRRNLSHKLSQTEKTYSHLIESAERKLQSNKHHDSFSGEDEVIFQMIRDSSISN